MIESGTTTSKDQLERGRGRSGRRFASKPRKGLRTSILPKRRGNLASECPYRRTHTQLSLQQSADHYYHHQLCRSSGRQRCQERRRTRSSRAHSRRPHRRPYAFPSGGDVLLRRNVRPRLPAGRQARNLRLKAEAHFCKMAVCEIGSYDAGSLSYKSIIAPRCGYVGVCRACLCGDGYHVFARGRYVPCSC